MEAAVAGRSAERASGRGSGGREQEEGDERGREQGITSLRSDCGRVSGSPLPLTRLSIEQALHRRSVAEQSKDTAHGSVARATSPPSAPSQSRLRRSSEAVPARLAAIFSPPVLAPVISPGEAGVVTATRSRNNHLAASLAGAWRDDWGEDWRREYRGKPSASSASPPPPLALSLSPTLPPCLRQLRSSSTFVTLSRAPVALSTAVSPRSSLAERPIAFCPHPPPCSPAHYIGLSSSSTRCIPLALAAPRLPPPSRPRPHRPPPVVGLVRPCPSVSLSSSAFSASASSSPSSPPPLPQRRTTTSTRTTSTRKVSSRPHPPTLFTLLHALPCALP